MRALILIEVEADGSVRVHGASDEDDTLNGVINVSLANAEDAGHIAAEIAVDWIETLLRTRGFTDEAGTDQG